MSFDLPRLNSATRGAPTSPFLTDLGSLMVGNRQLPLYEATKAGRVFHGNSAAAGVILPIYSNTAQKVGLWNASTTVNAVLTRVAFTYVSTTGAAGGLVLAAVSGAGSALGGNITVFTESAALVTNGLVGGGLTAKCKFTGSAATVAAPTIYRHIGFNQLVITAADATNAQWKAHIDFDGDVIIPPGSALFLAGNIATLITLAPSITWVEEDI